ncbi:MAG: hypothetical protein RL026_213 [Pseudomonadota bacterium]|jgi:iron complex outermembrane receptor protein
MPGKGYQDMINYRNTTALAVALAIHGTTALAGEASPASLEEITVTAERRETNLQDTPLSLVALTTEKMEAKGVEDLGDLSLYTPNLDIKGGRGSGTIAPTFSIRGISGGGGVTGERGVGLYIDGIFVPRTNGSVFKVFDLERVEVLRGPQGTLFGRNSTGGAISLVTRQPTQKTEAYLKATLGNFSRRDFMGMVNLPLGDKAALRLQAAHLEQDGFVKRGTQMLGGSEDLVLRGQLAVQINDRVKWTVGVMHSNSTSDGNPADFENWDMAPGIIEGNYADWVSDALAAAGQPRLATTNDPRIIQDDYTLPDFCFLDDWNPDWDKACEQYNNNRYSQADSVIQWSIGEASSLKLTTGYSKLDHRGLTDWQTLGTERRPTDVASETAYHELQLNTSLFADKVDLVLGANYFSEDAYTSGEVVNRRGTSAYAGQAQNGNADAGLVVTGRGSTDQKTDSYGVFGSATWHVTEKLNFTGGLRYSDDSKDYEQIRLPGSGVTNDFVPATGTDRTRVTTDKSWSQVDWRATVDYHFTQDIMAYATASKAYKAGQISYTVLQRVAGPDQSGDFIKAIPPEKVKNYEVGARMTFLDGRLRFNPTAYYMEWTNRQAARQVSCAAEGVAACPVGFRINVVNSGDVDIWGYELDAQWAITDQLSLDGALGVTDYRLLDPVANSGPNLFPAQASPTWNLGATYRLPDTAVGNFSFNLSYASVGSQETHPTSADTTPFDSGYLLPSYGLLNGRIQWTTSDRRNTISLFANNLTDKTYANYATRFGGGYWDSGAGTGLAAPPRSALQVVRGRPREIGITLQHNFF